MKQDIKKMIDIMGNAALSNLCHIECDIDTNFDNECSLCRQATALHKAGYRKQSETVKEFAEQIDLYLIKLFHQAHDSQKECEQHNGTVWENGWQRKDERMIIIQDDIQPFIKELAEQYGKEE